MSAKICCKFLRDLEYFSSVLSSFFRVTGKNTIKTQKNVFFVIEKFCFNIAKKAFKKFSPLSQLCRKGARLLVSNNSPIRVMFSLSEEKKAFFKTQNLVRLNLYSQANVCKGREPPALITFQLSQMETS